MSLVLKVLGPPGVWVEGQAVSFRSRKSLALLVYLALQPGRHSREALTALLWPDSDSQRGRATLRRTLALLRQEVGPALESALEAERESLALTLGAVIELDSAHLDRAQLALRAPARDSVARLTLVQSALDQYRAEFLHGFSLPDAPEFDTWVSTQREARLRQVAQLFDALTNDLIAARHVAIEPAARWVALDPLDEHAQRRLMQAHAAAGDRAGALAAYDQCRAVLARELDVEPDPETQALAESIRYDAEKTTMDDRRRMIGDRAPAPVQRRASIVGRLTAVEALVGRAHELQTLLAGLSTTLDGPQVFAITGESGIGKTRLAQAFVRQGAALGWEVMIGRALDLTVRLPYQAYVDALRERFTREIPPVETSTLEEIGRLVPEVLQRLPAPANAPADDPHLGQHRLYGAIAALTQGLAHPPGLVLLLDDAQWLDGAARDLTAFLLNAWVQTRAPVVVVLTLRAEDGPAWQGWVGALQRLVPVRVLPLAELDLAETEALVASLTSGARISPAGAQSLPEVTALAERLYAETHGHPLFVVETVRGLMDQGALRRDPDGRHWHMDPAWAVGDGPSPARDRDHSAPAGRGMVPIPETVRSLIHDRVARLSLTARSVLRATAILGTEATFDLVRHLTGFGEDEAANALDEAVGRRLLRETSGDLADGVPAGRIVFIHEQVRIVTLEACSPIQRRLLHRRALAGLRVARAEVAILALHAEAAGDADAARLRQQAGDQALAVFAADEACSHYQAALDQTPALTADEIAHTHLGLARAHEIAGRWPEARSAYEGLREFATTQGADELTTMALTRLATFEVQHTFDIDAGLSFARQALANAERHGQRRQQAQAAWNLAQIATAGWRPEHALPFAEQAVQLADELADPGLRIRSLLALAETHGYLSRWQPALDAAERAHALLGDLSRQGLAADLGAHVWTVGAPSPELEEQTLIATVLWNLALYENHRGEVGSARLHAEQALAMARQTRNPWTQVSSLINLTHSLKLQGDVDAACRAGEDGAALAVGLPNPAVQFWMSLACGAAQQAAGDLVAARLSFARSLALTDQRPMKPAHRAVALSRMCALNTVEGDIGAALAAAEEAVAIRVSLPARLLFNDFTRHLETRALVRAGRLDLATADVAATQPAAAGSRLFDFVWRAMRAELPEHADQRPIVVAEARREMPGLGQLLAI